jgi:hypothetical protein
MPSHGQLQGRSFGRDNISNYIRGETLPRSPALAVMARVLECSPSDLLPPRNSEKATATGVMIELTGELSFRRTIPMSVALKVLQVLDGLKQETR